MYRYMEEDLVEEELYLKGHLKSFCHKLGYVGGVFPSDLAFKTWLKKCIQIPLIMDAKSKKMRRIKSLVGDFIILSFFFSFSRFSYIFVFSRCHE